LEMSSWNWCATHSSTQRKNSGVLAWRTPPNQFRSRGDEEVEEDDDDEGDNPVGILDALLTAQKKRKRAKKSSSSIEDKVARYFEEDSTDDPDPLHWWRQKENLFPRIARLARKYLALLASERIFSKMNVICDKRRNSLDPDRVERMVFIKQGGLRGVVWFTGRKRG
jgi:hypothetical protein